LTGSPAQAWGKRPTSYTAVPATQVAPVASGYLLTPKHRFGHHHAPGQFVAAGTTSPSGYTINPSGYTLTPSGFSAGCTGTSPSGYTLTPSGFSAGCTGAPSGYTLTPSGFSAGCTGTSPGSITTPRKQTTPQADTKDLDDRLARWGKGGGVSVRVDVKVYVDGALVEGGGQGPAEKPEQPVVGAGDLLARLKAAFAEDKGKEEQIEALSGMVFSAGTRLESGALSRIADLRRSLNRGASTVNLPKTVAALNSHLDTMLANRQIQTAADRAKLGKEIAALSNVIDKVVP
jgi:hypothetical protein